MAFAQNSLIKQSYRTYIAKQKTDKILLKHLLAMKKRNERISMITCYDSSQALLADHAQVDSVLVGDSCANVMMGLKNTNQITLDAIIHHTQAVSRTLNRAYLIADMPFGTYLNQLDAVRNAARLVGEGGASCVKLEGFVPNCVKEISQNSMIVACHLGLMPQTADCFGTRGRSYSDIKKLEEQALILQDAGASMLILEKVCSETAAYISRILDIPCIGIGSGPHLDGQVLVWHDMLGLGDPNIDSFKFVKRYSNLSPSIISAIRSYIGEVKEGKFPSEEHSYYLNEKTIEKMKNDEAIWNRLNDSSDAFFKSVESKPIKNEKNPKIVQSAKDIRKLRNDDCSPQQIVFVPFLGGLHDGHFALIKEAKKYNDHQIWCSLFLNPLQFNQTSDYENYPYDMNKDIEALSALGVDVIFIPEVEEVYPKRDDSLFDAFVSFDNVDSQTDEGVMRPGHFKGVGTVLTKFFSWIRPHKAIFGQKDFIQCVIVRNLCNAFFPDTQIIVHPTVRESDGLAMSSRNNKLSALERKRAPLLYKCLNEMAHHLLERIDDDKIISIKETAEIGITFAKRNDFELEYISFHNGESGAKLADELDAKTFIKSNEMVISIAGSVGTSTRLIDNIVINNSFKMKAL